MVPESKWKWFGLAGHFCEAHDCLFHMATRVGGYFVSSVGALVRPANRKRDTWNRVENWEDIAFHRKFETFVFSCGGRPLCYCGCGMPDIELCEIETKPAQNMAEAQKNHMTMCRKYAKKKPLRVARVKKEKDDGSV